MIMTTVGELGPWTWWVLGLILLGFELILPGIFLLWVGASAMVIGAISFALWGSPIWPWQVQMTLFAILAVLSSYMGKKFYADRQGDSDEPLLNQRTQALIGRKADLEEPITNGRGRIKLNDSIWMIEGPDLEAGQTVEVVAANSNRLTVIQA